MTTFFAVCFLVGLGLSIVSFLSGFDDLDLFDHIFGHHGPAKLHVPKAIAHGSSVSPFNIAALTAFLAWFGGTGIVMQQLSVAVPAIFAAAIAAGAVGASVVNRFMSALMRREKNVEALTMTGTIARVIVTIREGGTGEIVFTHGGTRQVAGARSDSGVAIARGTEVVVTRHEKGIAYVATWEQLTPP